MAKEEAEPKPAWMERAFLNGRIGNSLLEAGQYDKALIFHHKGLAIYLEKLDKEHSNVAASYNNIGNVHLERAEYDKALGFYQKSLDIKLKKAGKNHPDVAAVYMNIGLMHDE